MLANVQTSCHGLLTIDLNHHRPTCFAIRYSKLKLWCQCVGWGGGTSGVTCLYWSIFSAGVIYIRKHGIVSCLWLPVHLCISVNDLDLKWSSCILWYRHMIYHISYDMGCSNHIRPAWHSYRSLSYTPLWYAGFWAMFEPIWGYSVAAAIQLYMRVYTTWGMLSLLLKFDTPSTRTTFRISLVFNNYMDVHTLCILYLIWILLELLLITSSNNLMFYWTTSHISRMGKKELQRFVVGKAT